MQTALFNALADPNRLHIVELLRQESLTVGEIATRLHLRQPQASKHIRVLTDAGVIQVQAQANRRVCSLRLETFRELDDWLSTFRQLWEERFDQLETYLNQLQAPPPDAKVLTASPDDATSPGENT